MELETQQNKTLMRQCVYLGLGPASTLLCINEKIPSDFRLKSQELLTPTRQQQLPGISKLPGCLLALLRLISYTGRGFAH